MSEKESVIRPGDIPVKTKRYKTVLSPVVSDLAASFLIDPLEVDVTPPRRYGFIDIAAIRRKIRATRRKVNRLLKKYE